MNRLLTEEIKHYIGMETELQLACDPVERGAVRRFAQAAMDLDLVYMDADIARDTRYGEPVAPPFFPVSMLRPAFDSPDEMSEKGGDPDYDGVRRGSSLLGLPPLPLNLPQLNGGTEFEVFRCARYGEQVSVKSRYKDIYERETSKGPMLFVIVETDCLDASGGLICRFRRTLIRRGGKPS